MPPEVIAGALKLAPMLEDTSAWRLHVFARRL
jgi:hypothetical protein